MNTDPEVQASRAAKRATPADQKRRLRRYSRQIASVAGKRIGTGTVWSLDGLAKTIETMADVALLRPRVRKLVLLSHDAVDTADALGLLCCDVMEDLQWYGASRRGWVDFDARDPSTWPRRRK